MKGDFWANHGFLYAKYAFIGKEKFIDYICTKCIYTGLFAPMY
jgi:hypothetical protein